LKGYKLMVRATGHEHTSLTAGAEIERHPSMKSVLRVQTNPNQHWVGDGFPVRTLLFYGSQGSEVSPFLLLDFAGPHEFKPASKPRGVGQHPHRGFETVTIVYAGEVTHRDSTGQGGTIGPGDVQWMTAGSGILHEEFHSLAFTRSGGPFRMVQLWVNLLAADKMSRPRYQSILSNQIPSVTIAGGAGRVRVIAATSKIIKVPPRRSRRSTYGTSGSTQALRRCCPPLMVTPQCSSSCLDASRSMVARKPPRQRWSF
jgi:redox-sensitive bicupin YhaK (pirin superfamily)